MEQTTHVKSLIFDRNDSSIHEFAAYALLTKPKESIILQQSPYAYELDPGSLYYKKESYRDWVLVANWCLYGAYILIRYKRAVWLKPFYEALFKRMNFLHVSFNKYCIEVLDTNGHFRSSRIFRLSPPGGLEVALSEIHILSKCAAQKPGGEASPAYKKADSDSRFRIRIDAMLKGHFEKLKHRNPNLTGVEVLSTDEVKHDAVLARKLAVGFNYLLLVPDVDSIIAWIDPADTWKSQILAVVCCKTSLREGITHACYWKQRLLSSYTQKEIRVLLVTSDKDNVLTTGDKQGRFNGKCGDVVSERELDGIYILKRKFKASRERERVKSFNRIFQDIMALVSEDGR